MSAPYQKFQDQYPMKARKAENEMIRSKYPNSIPVILWIDKAKARYRRKYLVPPDLTITQFLHWLKDKQTVQAHEGHYLIVNDTVIPQLSMTISQLDQEHPSEDGFLYISLFQESVFG